MVDRLLYDKALVVKYKEGDVSYFRNNEVIQDDINDKLHIVQDNQTLQTISHFYYGSSSYWFLIADKNIESIDNIFELAPGTKLIIPNKFNL
jgi:nucleoid-associated protein YgaU